MDAAHEILATVVLLTQLAGGQVVGHATGFFYLREETVYLVTNRHVVRDDAAQHQPETLRLRMHADPSDLSRSLDFDVPLYAGSAARWHDHPRYPNPAVDVVVVELDQQALKVGHYLKALSRENFLPDSHVMAPGEDVMVIGFPRGFSDTTHNLPILRNAMVASAYGIDFRGEPLFLIDSNLHPGTSGSPVITRPKNTWQMKDGSTAMMTGTPMYLVGVHSATLSARLPTGQEPLGLAQVWYADVIEQILDGIGLR